MNDDERENGEAENGEPVRIPLWRNAAREIARSYKAGDFIEVSWLLKQLRREPPTSQREAMEFGFEISNIRRYLEDEPIGLYISGRGLHGEKLQLLHQRENLNVMQAYTRRGIDVLRRAVILGGATDRSALTEEEATRHDSYLCKCAARLALMTRRNPQSLFLPPKQKKLKQPEDQPTA